MTILAIPSTPTAWRRASRTAFSRPIASTIRAPTWISTAGAPGRGQIARDGAAIPDQLYSTKDYETTLVLKERTATIAEHLSDYLKSTNRFAKTIIFCVDQEHAARMRSALYELNTDLTQRHPDYIVRITSDEGDVGATHLDDFMDPENPMPVIATTSKLLTTGVDVPTCKNIVLARVINSMTEFKQIIGRGTRVDTDHDKFFFNILDFTGSAMARFADPEFDGEPLPPPGDNGKKPDAEERAVKMDLHTPNTTWMVCRLRLSPRWSMNWTPTDGAST